MPRLISAPAPMATPAQLPLDRMEFDDSNHLDWMLQGWKDQGFRVRIARLDEQSRQGWGVIRGNEMQYLLSGYRSGNGMEDLPFNVFTDRTIDTGLAIRRSEFCQAAGIELEPAMVARIREHLGLESTDSGADLALETPDGPVCEQEGALPPAPVETPVLPPVDTMAAPLPRQLHVGYFTVVRANGTHRTFRISEWDGRQVVGYLNGPDNTRNYQNFAFLQEDGTLRFWRRFRDDQPALVRQLEDEFRTLRQDVAGAGERYALESSRCCRCHRMLTVPASIHRGLGPECAQILGH